MNDEARSGGSAMWNVVKNVLIFVVLGPPVSALTLSILTVIYLIGTAGHVTTGSLTGQQIAMSLFVLVWGIVVSYVFGVLPALLAGAMVGVGQILFRSFGFFHAAAVGLAVGLALYWQREFLTFGYFKASAADRLPETALLIASFGFICVVPTIVCWAISRRMLRRNEQASSC